MLSGRRGGLPCPVSITARNRRDRSWTRFFSARVSLVYALLSVFFARRSSRATILRRLVRSFAAFHSRETCEIARQYRFNHHFAASAVSQTFSLHLNVMIQLSPVSGTCADPGVWSITDTRSAGFPMGIYAIFRAGGRSPVQIFPPLVGQPRNLAFAFVGIESPGLLLFIMNKWSSCSQRRFRVVSEVRRGRRELRPRIEA